METVVTTSSPSSLRCSSKNEATNLNASIQQQQQQEQESHSYDNWEEETATKKKKLLEKQTLPFEEFSAISHHPQSHFLPSPPQNYKHDQHFPCAAQPQMLQPHLHSTGSFAHQIHLHGWGRASPGQKNEFGVQGLGFSLNPKPQAPALVAEQGFVGSSCDASWFPTIASASVSPQTSSMLT